MYSSNTHQIYVKVGFSLGDRTDNIMTSSDHITVHKSENIHYRNCIRFESDIFIKGTVLDLNPIYLLKGLYNI